METNDRSKSRARPVWLRVLGVLVAGIALLSVLGWILKVPLLASLRVNLIPMAPSTAVLLFLCGLAIGLRAHSPLSRLSYWLNVAVGSLVGVSALLLFTLSSLNIHWAGEHLGLHITGTLGGVNLGHMSPITSLGLLFASVSMLASLAPTATRSWCATLASASAGVLLGVSSIFLLAYIYGAPLFYGSSFIPPALNTVIALLLLGVALLVLTYSGPLDQSGEDFRMVVVLVSIFLLLTAGVTSIGYRHFRNYEQNYRAGMEQQLSAVADLKVRELVQWRHERLADAAILFNNPSFAALVGRFFSHPEDADAPRQLQDWLEKYLLHNNYEQVRLLDIQGVTRMSIPSGLKPAGSDTRREVSEVLRSRQIAIQDFYRHEPDPRVFLSVMAPIFDGLDSSRELGVIVLRIDPQTYLYPFVNRWPSHSVTSETLLVRRDGTEVLYLNDLRHQPHTALALRVSLEKTEVPAVRAVLGQTGIMQGVDYRGVPVLATTQRIPDSPWFLVAKMDMTEVDGPMRERLWQVVVLVAILLLSAGVGVERIWRRQANRSHKEQAETAQALWDSETLLKESQSTANLGSYVLNIRTGWWTSSDVLDQVLGIDPNYEHSVAGWLALIHPDDRTMMSEFFAKEVVGKGQPFNKEYRIIRHDDQSERWVQGLGRLEFDVHGQPERMLGTIWDIDERKRTEEALRTEKLNLDAIFDASPVAMLVLDETTNVVMANLAAAVLAGGSESDVLHRRPGNVLHCVHSEEDPRGCGYSMACPHCALRNGIESVIAHGGRIHGAELALELIRNGKPRQTWMRIGAEPVLLNGRRHLCVAMEDITLRKQAEEKIHTLNAELEQRVLERTTQLEHANKELEAFSYSVSHDLRAPLRHVQGYVDMLKSEVVGHLSVDGQRYMKTIVDASRRMALMIDDLLAFSLMGRKEMCETRVNLDQLVQDSLRSLEPVTCGRNINWILPPLPAVLADPAMLKLALINLLGNAVKYTLPRNPAQIEMGCAGTEDSRVILFVRDNGVGFDPQYAHKLFGVFQRLHRADEFEGTGIGLANVRRIIDRHGGRTWADGALDQGATFYFTLKPAPVTAPAHGE